MNFAAQRDKLSLSSNKGNTAKLLGIPASADTSICAQVAFFVHNPSSQVLSMFDCKYFRNMLAAIVNHVAENRKTPILNRKQLKRYIEAEHVRFKKRISTQVSV